MKNILVAILVLASLSSCQEQEKVAFVDNGKVINDYKMKIQIEEDFKVKDDDFKKVRDSIAQAFQIEAQAFNMAAQKMSKNEQDEKYRELSQKQQMLQQRIQYQQQVMQQQFNTEMDSVISKVNDFVEDYGKKNGYTFIFGKNQAGSVLYGAEGKDITEDITKAINDAFNSDDKQDKEDEKKAEEPKVEEINKKEAIKE